MQFSIVSVFFYLCLISIYQVTVTASDFRAKDDNKDNKTYGHVYKSYQGSIHCSPSEDILVPEDSWEVYQIIQRAINDGDTVKALGSRHSVTDVICTDGIPISMEKINYAKENKDGTATFGAGIELKDACEFLQKRNRSFIQVPTYAGITIGGAIGTGAHASSLIHPTALSDQVVSLSIIDGRGVYRKITSAYYVNAYRVHLGLLGVIIDVTFATVPLFKMTVSMTPYPEAILFNGTALVWARQFDWYQMWWFPSIEQVVTLKGTYLNGTSAEGNAKSNFIPDEERFLVAASGEMFEVLHDSRNTQVFQDLERYTALSLYTSVIGKPPLFSQDGGITLNNPATGYAWQMQANKCSNVCAWNNSGHEDLSIIPEDSSMAFDLKEFPKVFMMMKRILRRYPASFELIGVYIRFVKKSSALMSVSAGRETFTVEWITSRRKDAYTKGRNGIGAYQAILQAMITMHKSRPHWGKNGLHYFTFEVLQSAIPKLDMFTRAMKLYDPRGLFMNKFGERLLGQSDAMDKDPNVERCALQDYCICKDDRDCGHSEVCREFMGFNVCSDYIKIKPPVIHFKDISNWTAILDAVGV